MKRIFVGTAILGLCAHAGAAFAQAPPPPPPAFEGSAEFSFVGTSGNSATRTLGAATTLVFRPHDWEVTSKATVVRSEDRGTVKAQSSAVSTKVGRDLTPRMALTLSHKYARDQFAGINHRNTSDLGLTYKALTTEHHTLVVDGGVGYANEQRRAGTNLSSAIATAGFDYKWALSSNASLSNESNVVVSLKDGNDRRFANVASLSAKLTSLFSLKVAHTTRWVKSPVPGFKKTDTITAVALVAKF